jgi:hypothetical protein
MASLAVQPQQQSTNPIATGTSGLYFYVNTITTPTDQNLQRLLGAVGNTGSFTNISTDQSEYQWACTQVRKAGGNTGYACGGVIGPNFFDADKMLYTINYVILLITPRDESSMGTSSAIKARSGVTPVATHGFVVLRDLTRVTNGIFQAIEQKKQQKAYPGSEYFEQLKAYLTDEPMLYIEGLCANRAAGRGAGMHMMDLVHRIALDTGPDIYQGCKLSALVYVIQFYFRKFSYRFRKGCYGDGATKNLTAEELRHLNNMVPRLPRLPEDDAAYDYTPWVEFLKLLSISGFNAQTTQEQAARVLTLRDSPIEMFDEDGDIYAVTSRLIEALKKLGWEDQGYKMYFCFYNDPLFGVDTFAYSTPFTRQIIQAAREASGKNPARESATGVTRAIQSVQGPTTTQEVRGMLDKSTKGRPKQGGRKRRRKRTKKRALKKKHRRTKRKRKRKTRRKKRGGRHKLSHKKCKILRHQHSKLAQSLNLVGKALQTQCKKRL